MKAVVFGGSGLTGSWLIRFLKNDPSVISGGGVLSFVRKPSSSPDEFVEEIICDFSELQNVSDKITGDVLFCCIGTTIRKAGSQTAFREIDYAIPVKLGEIAAANGIKKMIVVSSLGADPSSGNFYLSVKGQMERDVTSVFPGKLYFMCPSLLLGDRMESRPGETIGKIFMQMFRFLLPVKFRPVHAKTVALAMLHLAKTDENLMFAEAEIPVLAEKEL